MLINFPAEYVQNSVLREAAVNSKREGAKQAVWRALLHCAAASAAQGAALALFPPACAGCGRRVAAAGLLCPRCWGKMPFISPPYCPVTGAPFRFDPGAGFISGAGLSETLPFARARAAALHGGLAQRLVSRLKYSGQTELAAMMAAMMAAAGAELLAECDYIVPLPLHRRRFWQRGYNQSAELGRHLARLSGRAFAPDILQRRKHTRPQVGLSAKKRAENVRGVFVAAPAAKARLKGKRLLLVDDVYTTGATVKAAAKTLLRAGAAQVDTLTFSRALRETEF